MDRFVVLAAVTVIFMAVIVPAALFWHGRLSPRAHMRRRVEALGALFAERPAIGGGRGGGGGRGRRRCAAPPDPGQTEGAGASAQPRPPQHGASPDPAIGTGFEL